MKVVLATGNADKLREVREILEPSGFEVVGIKSMGLTQDAEETGKTFAANSAIKAGEIYGKLKSQGQVRDVFVMADDSGLCIDAFDGGPGVESARFLGHETSYEYKNQYILDRLEGMPDEKRGACYVCDICVIGPDGREFHAGGRIDGRIAYSKEGDGGFGYDPIFYLPEYGATMACISEEEKNRISHRGAAVRASLREMEKYRKNTQNNV